MTNYMEIKIGGIYRHYKNGQSYHVLGLGKHSETMEDLVFYEPMYESETKFWARPVNMFLEEVMFEGQKVPRFKFFK